MIQRRKEAWECLACCLVVSWVISAQLNQISLPSFSPVVQRGPGEPGKALSPLWLALAFLTQESRGTSKPRVQQTRASFRTHQAGHFPLGSGQSWSLNATVSWEMCTFVPDTPSTPPFGGGERPTLAVRAGPQPAAAFPLSSATRQGSTSDVAGFLCPVSSPPCDSHTKQGPVLSSPFCR